MRTYAKLFLTLSLLLVCGTTSLAQKKKSICPVPPPSPFHHSGSIVTSFDRATNGMRTTLEHPGALSHDDGVLYLFASFVHQDPRRPLSRQMVDIVFYSTAKHLKYREAHDLLFVTDGRQIPFSGGMARYRSQTEGGLVYESTQISVPYDVLLSMINSRHVSARIGATQFEISNNHLEALRELASLIAPSQGSWGTH